MNSFDPGALIGMMLALLIWLKWYTRIVPITRLASTHRERLVVYLMPVVCLLVLPMVLLGAEVANPRKWTNSMLGCYAAGVSFLSVFAHALPWFGLSPRDDVVERRNVRAGWAIGGALMGATLAYGTATRDSNPFVGLLSIVVLSLLWVVFVLLTDASEAITVDRRGGVAFRLATMAPALGWSVGQCSPRLLVPCTVPELLLLLGGPVCLLLASILVELAWKRNIEKSGDGPKPGDLAIALGYCSGAGFWTFLTR